MCLAGAPAGRGYNKRRMIILLHGEDSYGRERKLKDLVREYRSKHVAADLLSADLDDDPGAWVKVRDFLSQPSLFVDSKIAVIRGGASVNEKGWAAALRSELESARTFIVISDQGTPLRALAFLLKPPVLQQTFPLLEGSTLSTFVRKEAAVRKLAFAGEGLRFFLEYVTGYDADPGDPRKKRGMDRGWLIINELEKVRLAGFEEPISEEDLRSLLRWSADSALFSIAGKILRGSTPGMKLISLETALRRNDAPHVFNLVSYQASGALATSLAHYDISIKSGGLEYEEALTSFALQNGTPSE